MKIANIVHEGDLVNHKKMDFVNYYDKPIKYEDLNKSLPTLYVGWKLMRETNKGCEIFDNANILKHKIISNSLYWEFSFDENKSSHVKGLESFIIHAPNFYFSPKYSYIDLDPVFFQISNTQDLFDVLPNKIDAALFASGNMIYILKDKKITGLNIEMYGFFDFNIDEIVKKIKERCIDYYDDSNGAKFIEFSKIFPKFSDLKRYLIVLLTN